MAASILKKARERRDAALHEVRMWEEFIRRYEELREASPHIAPTLFAMLDAKSAPRTGGRANAPEPASGPALPPESEMAKTIALVDAVLDEHGRPVQLHDLYAEITRRGLAISGKFPRANLGARLSSAGKYISINKKTGWWFKDRPCPAGAFETARGDEAAPEDEARTLDNGGLFDTPWGNAA
ncbi:MAG: hypothetical protein ACREE1_20260 [Stellaceae bacterium]